MKTNETVKPLYYSLIVNSYDPVGGVLYAPEEWPYPIAEDGVEVKDWRSLVVELRDGKYSPFHMCIGGANMVSEELKELLESYIEDKDSIEFLPVKAVSEKYGDRTYYIMHFTKVFDVIDRDKTVYVPGTDDIIKVRLDYEKVKNLNVFNFQSYINEVIVSAEVRKSIKKNKLDGGLQFTPIYCGYQIE